MAETSLAAPETLEVAPTPQEWLDAARELAERFAEGAAERDRDRIFPHRELEELRESGLEALLVPHEHGGLGGRYVDQVRITGILAEGDPNIAQLFLVQGIGVEIVNQAAPAHLQREFGERTAQRRLRWTNAYSELGTKHIFEYRVRIRPDGPDEYLLSGDKFYCTGSLGGDEMFVTAVIDGTDELRLVFVPTDAPGVTILDDWAGMGQVTTASGTTRFEDVRIPADRVVAMDSMNVPESVFGPLGQLQFSAIHLGIAKNAMQDAIEYVRAKARPWVHSGVERALEDPYTLMRLGEMKTWTDAAEGMQERAIHAMGVACEHPSAEGRALASVATSQAKAFTTKAGLEVCQMLFQVCGSSATLKKYNYDRHWRNLRTLSLHDPSDYKLRMVGDFYVTGNLPPVTAYT